MTGFVDNDLGQLDIALQRLHVRLDLDHSIVTISPRRDDQAPPGRREEIVPSVRIDWDDEGQIIAVQVTDGIGGN